jgi:ATP-dependent helicase/nuclease subunit A
VIPAPGRPQPAQRRLSYSSLQDYARCGYRFYLSRVLGLPRVAPPDPISREAARTETARGGGAASGTAATGGDTAGGGAASGTAATGGDAAGGEATGVTPLDGRIRGTLVHQLLERLDFARPAPPGADQVRALAASHELELDPEHVEDIIAQVAAFARSPLCDRLAQAGGVRREAGFAFELSPGGGGPLVSGFVDVLARERDGSTLIVDYKTDRLLDDEQPAVLVERDYATQRMVYALAALHAGAPRVEVAYCLLERPEEPVAATFHETDAPALADTLLRLASGELCGDCPGRRALCSWPEAMTLRPPADAYEAGSLAGSGGPS